MGNVTDDAGHLIGSRFGGVAEKINLVPMDAGLNRGAYRNLEADWAKALENGKPVTVKIEPKYVGDELRPDNIGITYSIDKTPVDLHFLNRPLLQSP
jgi:filamentous hemagglutinin